MSEFHEPPEDLSPETRDFRRALNSLKEEIEAIDWYQQRIDSTKDEELKKIIEHNKLEEMEHAMMALEWLRRNMPGWDKKMRQYLFKKKDIVELEEDEVPAEQEDLGIGKIK
ncbi:MAG TPA: ferritin-like domain-containing protein [Ignavibacteriaceae bacterium]|jgi:ferritin-like protein|nr:ferritin-like domain-containing protein [Ignavibacteriaceae bacterium]